MIFVLAGFDPPFFLPYNHLILLRADTQVGPYMMQYKQETMQNELHSLSFYFLFVSTETLFFFK